MTTFKSRASAPVIFTLLAIAGNVLAHGDGKPLYVAEGGTDAGDCKDRNSPCATIGYALQFTGKGGQIRVAEGTYAIDNAADIFHLVSGALDVSGGFKQGGNFEKSTTGNSVLTGVPYEYRDLLKSRGFQVIADQKAARNTGADKLLRTYQQLKSSMPATPCINGMAGNLPCNDVDLLSHVGFNDMSVTPSSGTDVWGFTDLNTMREYGIVGFNLGTAVYDVTDAENPREVGFIDGQDTAWRDVKVYQFFDAADDRWKAYAYLTAERSTDGLNVIDMTGLPHSIARVNYSSDFASAHNVYSSNTDYATGIALNNDSPELIVAGSNRGVGQYRAYSLANPDAPAFVAGGTGTGYMHDASSMIITDARMNSQCVNATTYCQVLLDFNEDSFEIWDVTDSASPVQLSDTPYINAGYVHSGWWSEDRQFIFVHDELDEQRSNLFTTLRIFSVANLTSPVHSGTWTGPTVAIDHNGFVRGNRYYMSNYTRGLTVLDITTPANPQAVGRLDTYPVGDGRNFNGAWGAYPYFFSGNIAISDIDSGFYMAEDKTRNVNEGSFSFDAASAAVDEGQQITLSVQRNGGSTGAVSVNYEFVHATAAADDYQVTSGVLQWPAGDIAPRTIDIDASNDGVAENMEQLFVRLISPTGGATLANLNTASVYISEPGAASSVGFAETNIETTERGFGVLVAVLRRQGSAIGAASIDYSMTAGDATDGVDFVGSTSGTVNWAAGDGNPKVLEFIVDDDGVDENDESFELTLNNPIGATLSAASKVTAIIRNGNGANIAPIANAGANQVRASGSQVTLNGSQSSDPNNDVLSYQWAQTSGSAVTLNNANQASASFTAPNVTSDSMLVFELTVSDPAGLSDSASTTITVTKPAAAAAAASGGGGGAISLLFFGSLGLLLLGRGFSRKDAA